jgi:hypothetical protein
MSFNFSFSARTRYEAQTKLHDAYASAIVKALVERALDAVPFPATAADAVKPGAAVSSSGSESRPSSGNVASRQPICFGVYVEVAGHLADAGDGGGSDISRFTVRPLYA